MENNVSLFIPVYNAARLIRKILRQSYYALLQLHNDFEIIIVDDNSPDSSYRFKRIIDSARQIRGKEIRYISYTKGPSRRENLAKSFHLANYEIIGFIDADFSCDVLYFLQALDMLKEKSADIVIGSRYIKGAKVQMHVIRRIFSFFYNMFIRMFFKSKIKDHQCGLKVFRRSSTMQIISEMGYDSKYIRGWFWDAEFLIRAQKAKLNIIEMPVKWHHADSSTFNIRRELKCLISIINLKRKLLKS
jgi:hypothetical protein